MFGERYVLGEGYPWAIGTGPYEEVALCKSPEGTDFLWLSWPKELWSRDLPRYRLVLELVQGKVAAQQLAEADSACSPKIRSLIADAAAHMSRFAPDDAPFDQGLWQRLNEVAMGFYGGGRAA